MEVALIITIFGTLPVLLIGGVFAVKRSYQREFDQNGRLTYRITFPADVAVDRATALLGTLPASIKAERHGITKPTMVFETISRGGAFEFRVRVPASKAEFIVAQLRSSIPGIAVEPVLPDDQDLGEFNAGFEIGMNLRDHQIEMSGKPADVAVSLLTSFNPIKDEALIMQWVVAGSAKLKMPETEDASVQSTNFSVIRGLRGRTEASRDEKLSRRSKVQTEPNFTAALRIAARSQHHDRSAALVHNVIMAIKASDGPRVKFQYREIKHDLSTMINEAWTPLEPKLQLGASELVPRVGWALGSDYIEGVSRAAFRHLQPSPDIPSAGVVLGVTTMPGGERPVAMPVDGFRTHAYFGGATEVGKTTLGVNVLTQLIQFGSGAVILERDGDLIRRTLNQLRPEDLDRVVHVDFSDPVNFVGINPFDFETPMQIASKLADLFERIYEIKGVNLRKLLFHGIPALAETGEATLLDFIPLVDPKTPADIVWSRDRIKKLKTKELVQFFDEWTSKGDVSRKKDMEPVLNRFWELTLDPQVSRMLNSTHSTVDLGAALRDNKIICINLKGVDTHLAELVGSMMVSWIWDLSASNIPEKADNVIFMDEAHLFSHLEGTIADMLATARKRRLGLVMATQYVTQMPRKVQEGISTNARTKIIFESGKNEARIHADDFASREVDSNMLMNLGKFTTVAKIKLPGGGVSSPITMRTMNEPPAKNHGHHAIAMSNQKYARTSTQIEAEQYARRHVDTNSKGRPDIGDEPVIGDWKDDI